MDNKEKYINDNFKNWKETYAFPDYLDFQIRTLFQLQYEFSQLGENHSKSQRDKLDMIHHIQGRLPQWFFNKTKTKE